MGGLSDSNFASCWDIFSLAFGYVWHYFLWLLLFYVQILKKTTKMMILDLSSGKILGLLLESCSLGGSVTCALTQLQYLNVSRSSAGVTQLRTARAWAAEKCFRETNASFHRRKPCFPALRVHTCRFNGLTRRSAQWSASVFSYCIVTVNTRLIND